MLIPFHRRSSLLFSFSLLLLLLLLLSHFPSNSYCQTSDNHNTIIPIDDTSSSSCSSSSPVSSPDSASPNPHSHSTLSYSLQGGESRGDTRYHLNVEHVDSILPLLSKESMVLFDLDGTLLVHNQSLGNDMWYDSTLASRRFCEKDLNRLWDILHKSSHMRLVEGVETYRTVRKAQKRAHSVMALTAQDAQSVLHSASELRRNGIRLQSHRNLWGDFASSELRTQPPIPAVLDSPLHADLDFDHDEPGGEEDEVLLLQPDRISASIFTGVREGIIFAAGVNKGTLLVDMLHSAQRDRDNIIAFPHSTYKKRLQNVKMPKHIVFVDNVKKNCDDVFIALTQAKFPKFDVVHYTGAEQHYKDYNPIIADIQLQYSTFLRILTDEEAQQLYETHIKPKMTKTALAAYSANNPQPMPTQFENCPVAFPQVPEKLCLPGWQEDIRNEYANIKVNNNNNNDNNNNNGNNNGNNDNNDNVDDDDDDDSGLNITIE